MVKKKAEVENIMPIPRDTAVLWGQEAAEQTLLDAWNSGRMHHAWLISGPKGIGKATLAYRFARFVLSQSQFSQAESGLFDNKAQDLFLSSSDPVFQRVAAGSHGDFLALEVGKPDAKGKIRKDIPVDEARNIGRFLQYTGSESSRRVVLIDSVDDMNRNAANAVLKVLEEPPKHALILLVSHNPGRLLPTIRSRCRTLKLQPIAQDDFIKVMQASIPDIALESCEQLFSLSEGAPGVAIQLYNGDAIGIYNEMITLWATLPHLDGEKLHKLADRLSSKTNEEAWPVFCFMLAYFFHALTIGNVRKWLVKDEDKVMRDLLQKRTVECWLAMWERVRQSLDDVDRINTDKKHVIINVFTAMKAAL